MDYEIDFEFLESVAVNEIGDVFHKTLGLLPVFEKNGQTFVNLPLFEKSIEVQSGLIVLIKNEMSFLPYQYWKDVEMFYKDSDIWNNTPKNLSYRFTRLIETESNPGLYLIPGFETHCISRDCELRSLRTNYVMKWSRTKPNEKNGTMGGYLYASMYQGKGYVRQFAHRLLGNVFIDLGRRLCGLVINHKDGRPDNNELTNLEWVTIAENVKHSWDTGLCVANSIAIMVRNMITGEIQRYRSAKKCADALGLSRESTVLFRLRKPDRVFRDRLQFKLDDGTPWRDLPPTKIVRNGAPQEVVCINIFTNDRLIFASVNEAARALDIPAVTAGKMALTRSAIPCKGFLFHYTDDLQFVTPSYNKEQLRFFMENPRRMTRAVVLKNETTASYFRNIMVLGKEIGVKYQELEKLLDTGEVCFGSYVLESISKNVSQGPR